LIRWKVKELSDYDVVLFDTNSLLHVVAKSESPKPVTIIPVIEETGRITGLKPERVYEDLVAEHVRVVEEDLELAHPPYEMYDVWEGSPELREIELLCSGLNLSSTDMKLVASAVRLAKKGKKVAIHTEDRGIIKCVRRVRERLHLDIDVTRQIEDQYYPRFIGKKRVYYA